MLDALGKAVPVAHVMVIMIFTCLYIGKKITNTIQNEHFGTTFKYYIYIYIIFFKSTAL